MIVLKLVPRLVADHTHKEPCTKTAGRDLFLFTHLLVERSFYLFI